MKTLRFSKNEALCLWSAVDSMRIRPTGDLAEICNAIERGLLDAGIDLDEELNEDIANNGKLEDAAFKKVRKPVAKGAVAVILHEELVERLRQGGRALRDPRVH